MLLPSGVSSASEARPATRATSRAEAPPSGTNWVARRLPIVIVPVLSSSSVSMSPATSTALPLLAMMFAAQGAVHAGDADGRQQGADRRRDQADEQGDQRRDVQRQVEVAGHRVERRRDDQEDEREGGQHDRQGDLVGRLLPDGPLDQGDHPVEEALPRLGRDPDDDPVGQDAGAAGDAGVVAAGLADHRGRLAGDRRLVHRGDPLDDLAVGRDHLPGLDHDEVAGPQLGRRDDLAVGTTRGPSRR